jgi:small-conductance mechanosensitive channel
VLLLKLVYSIAEWVSRMLRLPLGNVVPVVEVGARIVSILLIFIVASIVNSIVGKLIKYATGRRLKFAIRRNTDPRRIQTSSTILRSLLKYLIYFIAALMSLDTLGVNATSLLAGAGFAGLALGFGAQALIKDIISGFFLLFEDQYAVGDFVKIEGCEGIVEEIQMRVTKVRDFGGELHIIPNGNISKVTNYRSEGLRIWIAVTVDIREDLERVMCIFQAAMDAAKPNLEGLIDGPKVLGVEEVNELGAKIRIWAKGVPLKHWGIARDLNKVLKKASDENSIRFASPHRTIVIETGMSPIVGKEKPNE